MVLIILLPIIMLGVWLLFNVNIPVSKKALSTYSRLVLAFLKTAQILFAECLGVILSIALILLVCSNHFIIDYYIIILFSSLILIKYHTLKFFAFFLQKFGF